MPSLHAPPWHDSEEGQITKNDLIYHVGLVAVLRGAAAFIRMHNDYKPSFCATIAREDIAKIHDDGPIHEDAVRAILNRHRLSNLTR